MSEKFNDVWRKVKEGINFAKAFIPIVLLGGVFGTVIFLIWVLIKGVIVSVCWNVAMTNMFGLQKITIFQAFVLSFTIACLSTDYFGSAKLGYEKAKKKIFDKSGKEKIAKIVSVIFVILLEIIAILITVWTVRYSWNNLLPQLLNMELIQINFGQSLAFTYLANWLFGSSISDDKKSEDNENRDVSETEDDTMETIE